VGLIPLQMTAERIGLCFRIKGFSGIRRVVAAWRGCLARAKYRCVLSGYYLNQLSSLPSSYPDSCRESWHAHQIAQLEFWCVAIIFVAASRFPP
jgi:hypothetical protein